MALSDLDVKAQYTGNGSDVTFAIPYTSIFDEDTETKVYLADTLQTIVTNYTIVAGDIVFGTAPANSVLITVVRVLTLTQSLDLVSAGSVNLATLEKHLDGIMAKLQQVDEELQRAPKFKTTINNSNLLDSSLVLPDPVTDYLVGWNTAGDALINVSREELGETGGVDIQQCFVQDVKSGADGGTSATTSVQTRDLNNIQGDNSLMGITVASNKIKFSENGRFLIEWSAPAVKSQYHQTHLYNETASALEVEGSSEYSRELDFYPTRSFGVAVVAIVGITEFSIKHYTAVGLASSGLGIGTSSQLNNTATLDVYTQVKITKLVG